MLKPPGKAFARVAVASTLCPGCSSRDRTSRELHHHVRSDPDGVRDADETHREPDAGDSRLHHDRKHQRVAAGIAREAGGVLLGENAPHRSRRVLTGACGASCRFHAVHRLVRSRDQRVSRDGTVGPRDTDAPTQLDLHRSHRAPSRAAQATINRAFGSRKREPTQLVEVPNGTAVRTRRTRLERLPLRGELGVDSLVIYGTRDAAVRPRVSGMRVVVLGDIRVAEEILRGLRLSHKHGSKLSESRRFGPHQSYASSRSIATGRARSRQLVRSSRVRSEYLANTSDRALASS